MEDNVALDSSKQKQFLKSIKGIKKLVQKVKTKEPLNDVKKKPTTETKKKRKPRRERGLVYLGHIPHGFYENQMTDYFKQFGKVTNCRVIRSKKTGNSKGYAFVEFGDTTVAQIVAETMNNYLMGKRLLKAEYIPPEKQRRGALRQHWNHFNNPGNIARLKAKKEINRSKTEKEELVMARKFLKTFSKVKKNLSELGIEYDFVQPVDVPEELIENIEIKKEEDNTSKKNKSKGQVPIVKTETKDKKVDKKIEKTQNSMKADKTENKKPDTNAKKAASQLMKAELNKKLKAEPKKQVKPLEDFLSLDQSDTDDSDGSDDFDSDGFEQLGSDVDEFDTDDASDSQGDGDESEEEALEALLAKKVTVKSNKKQVAPVKKTDGNKRKAATSTQVSGNKPLKKQKFEKKTALNSIPKKRNNKNKKK